MLNNLILWYQYVCGQCLQKAAKSSTCCVIYHPYGSDIQQVTVPFSQVILFPLSQDMVGYNVHALQWMRREVEAAESEQLFRDATNQRRTKDKRRRTRHAVKRPIITVT